LGQTDCFVKQEKKKFFKERESMSSSFWFYLLSLYSLEMWTMGESRGRFLKLNFVPEMSKPGLSRVV
jgi:hypothetical protein